MRIVVTGGSGFIGTNLVEELILEGYTVCNIDIHNPKKENRYDIWKNIDICDYSTLRAYILKFNPQYIIHLAARTDLDGKKVDEYAANILGVENIMKISNELRELKKIIITSSKFVTPNGYKIKNQFDYCPHTVYGESKVITEKIVWNNRPKCDWCIIRPTSIWGPWFGVPYKNFFDIIRKGFYFHIGNKKCYKTYGYIGNAILQIKSLMISDTLDNNEKVYYIGDYEPYEIHEWADEIATFYGNHLLTAPDLLVRLVAKMGDVLNKLGVYFPMQSFRYKNMTNDGVNEMSSMKRICPKLKYSRRKGNIETIQWIKEYGE